MLLALLLAADVLVSRTPVDVALDGGRRSTTESIEAARRDARFGLERLTYLSDGLKVTAYLYGPRDAQGAPRPVIVYLRGGYLAGTPISALVPQFHGYAEAGYSVLAPQLRQSDGGEGRDEVGGADLDDVLVVPSLVRELGGLDASRLYLVGESRGGMMAYQALRDGFPARAAAVYGGFTDMAALIREHPDPYERLAPLVWPGYDTRRDEILARRSAVRWADKIAVPVLVMHGSADASVDVSHAQRMGEALKKAGRTYELKIFEGDGHTLPQHAAERDRLILGWFQQHP